MATLGAVGIKPEKMEVVSLMAFVPKLELKGLSK